MLQKDVRYGNGMRQSFAAWEDEEDGGGRSPLHL